MQAASFSHRLFRGSRERSLIGVVKTTSSTGGFIDYNSFSFTLRQLHYIIDYRIGIDGV